MTIGSGALKSDSTVELFDLCDPRGRLIGVTKPRSAVHRDGDWHRAFHCWVVTSWGRRPEDRGQGEAHVVLQRRSLQKATWPGLWDVSVGGHYSAGEGIEGGIREIAEELGLAVAVEELVHVGWRREEVFYANGLIEREVQDVYFLRRDVRLEDLRPDPEEVIEVALLPAAAPARLAAGVLDEIEAVGGRVRADSTVEAATTTITAEGLVPRASNYYGRVARLAERLVMGGAGVKRGRWW